MADHAATAADIIDAFNERDFERILHHLHPDYEATWPHGHLDGAAAVAHEGEVLAAIPGLTFHVERITATDDGALVELRARGRQEHDWSMPDGVLVPSRGLGLDLPMALVLVFDGGLVRSERLYFDQLTARRSLLGDG
jgi:hypothetical protein